MLTNPVTFRTAFLRSVYFQGLIFLGFILFLLVSAQTGLLQEIHFLNWDASHYAAIRENGYSGFLVAFFPLFPWIWKFSHLGVWGIVLFNTLLFLLSFSWLVSAEGINRKEQLLLQTVPSLMFMFIPYTEAIFFFSCTLLLTGLKKEQKVMLGTGFLLASLCRPTTYIFIPALLITGWLCRINLSRFVKESVVYSFILLGGLFLTIWVHYYFTGKWFVFFEAQKGWSNSFRLPELPLRSWAGNNIGRLDGTALLAGAMAGVFCIRKIIAHLKTGIKVNSPALLFSMCYLAGVSLIILLFRGGSLFSLNRFVFASPFFTLAFLYFIRNVKLSHTQVVWLLPCLLAYWLLFGSYVHIQAFLKFAGLSIFLTFPFLLNHPAKWLRSIAFWALVSANALMQIYFLFRFLDNQWVG